MAVRLLSPSLSLQLRERLPTLLIEVYLRKEKTRKNYGKNTEKYMEKLFGIKIWEKFEIVF
jgi:hypothetical protein